MTNLPCGHPEACQHDEYGEMVCAWCDQVKKLRSEVKMLREVIGKQSLIIHGDVTLSGPAVVTYLEVHGDFHIDALPVSIGRRITDTAPPHSPPSAARGTSRTA